MTTEERCTLIFSSNIGYAYCLGFRFKSIFGGSGDFLIFASGISKKK